ncbi:MAG: hypothetical protein LBT46_02465 [Planctomycetaceae bacterium]|jgi:hypothetical protein|nr:hypothetical protein [Planctomycetaceae bacterium]
MKRSMAAYTRVTKKGDCDMLACVLSEELDKIGINNWLLFLQHKDKFLYDAYIDVTKLKPKRQRDGHVANLIELSKGRFVVSDLTKDVKATSPFQRKKNPNPTPYYEYGNYMNKFNNEGKYPFIQVSRMNGSTYDNSDKFEYFTQKLQKHIAELPQKKERQRQKEEEKNREKIVERKFTDIKQVEKKIEFTSKDIEEMKRKRRLTPLAIAEMEWQQTQVEVEYIQGKIKKAPVLTFELRTESLEARIESEKAYLKYQTIMAECPPSYENVEVIKRRMSIAQEDIRELQAKLQELLAQQAPAKKQEPVRKPENTGERESVPAKKSGDAETHAQGASDNLREIKHLETRVKYFEMQMKYLEEPADKESNAAQLREVQAKLQELLAKQPAEKTGETPAKKPEKTSERKPAPAKKAGD